MRSMTTPTIAKASARLSGLARYFKITARGSTIGTEIRGGLVTFFAMAYIIVLNPLIIGTTKDGTGALLGGDNGLAKIAATTALVAGVMTLAMGMIANFPMALATGLGLNAVVAFTIAGIDGMSWADAMGLVVISGLIITVLVLTGFREAVFRAVPRGLKTAITVGIGLFITLVGLVNGGFVTKAVGTPLQMGTGGSLATWPVVVFCAGLVLIIILSVRKVKGALLIGIIGATVLAMIVEQAGKLGLAGDGNPGGWQLTLPAFPGKIVAVPDFSLIGHFSLFGAFHKIGLMTAVMLVFSLMLADFFDTMGTMVAVGSGAGLLDENGRPENTPKILVVDALACAVGGASSISSNTGYIESASGVGEGARTGLASVVTGVCFLLATFLSPVVAMVPDEAATPALVFVGFLMMTQVAKIKWDDWEIAIPAFLTIIVMPFTYSISAGLGAGFIAYVVVKVTKGKAKQIHPLMWVAAVLFIIYFAIDPIKSLFG
jgi:AGZA family xanthine/uracil permease-like MFS transporter